MLFLVVRFEMFGFFNNGFGFRYSDFDLCMIFFDFFVLEVNFFLSIGVFFKEGILYNLMN